MNSLRKLCEIKMYKSLLIKKELDQKGVTAWCFCEFDISHRPAGRGSGSSSEEGVILGSGVRHRDSRRSNQTDLWNHEDHGTAGKFHFFFIIVNSLNHIWFNNRTKICKCLGNKTKLCKGWTQRQLVIYQRTKFFSTLCIFFHKSG